MMKKNKKGNIFDYMFVVFLFMGFLFITFFINTNVAENVQIIKERFNSFYDAKYDLEGQMISDILSSQISYSLLLKDLSQVVEVLSFYDPYLDALIVPANVNYFFNLENFVKNMYLKGDLDYYFYDGKNIHLITKERIFSSSSYVNAKTQYIQGSEVLFKGTCKELYNLYKNILPKDDSFIENVEPNLISSFLTFIARDINCTPFCNSGFYSFNINLNCNKVSCEKKENRLHVLEDVCDLNEVFEKSYELVKKILLKVKDLQLDFESKLMLVDYLSKYSFQDPEKRVDFTLKSSDVERFIMEECMSFPLADEIHCKIVLNQVKDEVNNFLEEVSIRTISKVSKVVGVNLNENSKIHIILKNMFFPDDVIKRIQYYVNLLDVNVYTNESLFNKVILYSINDTSVLGLWNLEFYNVSLLASIGYSLKRFVEKLGVNRCTIDLTKIKDKFNFDLKYDMSDKNLTLMKDGKKVSFYVTKDVCFSPFYSCSYEPCKDKITWFNAILIKISNPFAISFRLDNSNIQREYAKYNLLVVKDTQLSLLPYCLEIKNIPRLDSFEFSLKDDPICKDAKFNFSILTFEPDNEKLNELKEHLEYSGKLGIYSVYDLCARNPDFEECIPIEDSKEYFFVIYDLVNNIVFVKKYIHKDSLKPTYFKVEGNCLIPITIVNESDVFYAVLKNPSTKNFYELKIKDELGNIAKDINLSDFDILFYTDLTSLYSLTSSELVRGNFEYEDKENGIISVKNFKLQVPSYFYNPYYKCIAEESCDNDTADSLKDQIIYAKIGFKDETHHIMDDCSITKNIYVDQLNITTLFDNYIYSLILNKESDKITSQDIRFNYKPPITIKLHFNKPIEEVLNSLNLLEMRFKLNLSKELIDYDDEKNLFNLLPYVVDNLNYRNEHECLKNNYSSENDVFSETIIKFEKSQFEEFKNLLSEEDSDGEITLLSSIDTTDRCVKRLKGSIDVTLLVIKGKHDLIIKITPKKYLTSLLFALKSIRIELNSQDKTYTQEIKFNLSMPYKSFVESLFSFSEWVNVLLNGKINHPKNIAKESVKDLFRVYNKLPKSDNGYLPAFFVKLPRDSFNAKGLLFVGKEFGFNNKVVCKNDTYIRLCFSFLNSTDFSRILSVHNPERPLLDNYLFCDFVQYKYEEEDRFSLEDLSSGETYSTLGHSYINTFDKFNILRVFDAMSYECISYRNQKFLLHTFFTRAREKNRNCGFDYPLHGWDEKRINELKSPSTIFPSNQNYIPFLILLKEIKATIGSPKNKNCFADKYIFNGVAIELDKYRNPGDWLFLGAFNYWIDFVGGGNGERRGLILFRTEGINNVNISDILFDYEFKVIGPFENELSPRVKDLVDIILWWYENDT